MKLIRDRHLGDGVEASHEGRAIVLSLIDADDCIYLEPEVFNALLEYQKELTEATRHGQTNT